MLFTNEKINENVTRIRDIAGTFIYLIEGSDKALLIDTGCGIGNLTEYVKTLTDKSIQVVLTHGHVDHALGTNGFKEVYISPKDKDIYTFHGTKECQAGYLNSLQVMGIDPSKLNISESDYMPIDSFDKFLPLNDGDTFELGSVCVTVFALEGHTPGSMVILINELKMLILGDAANDFTYLFDWSCPSVTKYKKNIKVLGKKVAGKYDRVLFSHGSGEGHPDMLNGVINVCDDIISGNVDNIPFKGFDNTPCFIAKAMNFEKFGRSDGGYGNIIYRPENI